MEIRVGNKFKLVKKLGSGAFGELFAGINIKTGEEVAIKLELIFMERPQLQYEHQVLLQLQNAGKFSNCEDCVFSWISDGLLVWCRR